MKKRLAWRTGRSLRIFLRSMRAALLVPLFVMAGCALVHDLPIDGGPDAGVDAFVVTTDAGPGRDAPAVHEAGGFSECMPTDATETRMPLFLFDTQRFAATVVRAPSSECQCTPQIPPVLATQSVSMQLCGCCEACDCSGGAYEASVENVSLPRGTTRLTIAGGTADVAVLAPGVDHPVTQVTSLSVVGPDPTRTRSGPALWWLRVEGTEDLCCVQPRPLVVDEPGAAGEIAIRVTSAANDPCNCAGTPQRFTAWHSLGELAPGDYHVRGGSMAASFTVPPGP
jgi:hypothetical protein